MIFSSKFYRTLASLVTCITNGLTPTSCLYLDHSDLWPSCIPRILQGLFDDAGYCLPAVPEIQQGPLKQPARLVWDVPHDLARQICKAVDFNVKVSNYAWYFCVWSPLWTSSISVMTSFLCNASSMFQNNDDLDLCVAEHTAYGKGFIKTCKVSLWTSQPPASVMA